MATYERVNEKTPCGGDYSEIFYFDDNGHPIEAEEATYAKNEKDNLSDAECNELRQLIKVLEDQLAENSLIGGEDHERI